MNPRGRPFLGTEALAPPCARERDEEEAQGRGEWGRQDPADEPGRPAARGGGDPREPSPPRAGRPRQQFLGSPEGWGRAR